MPRPAAVRPHFQSSPPLFPAAAARFFISAAARYARAALTRFCFFDSLRPFWGILAVKGTQRRQNETARERGKSAPLAPAGRPAEGQGGNAMHREPIAGTGAGPEGPELPLGFGMQLAQDEQALQAFGRLDSAQKDELIRYIKSAASGEDAKRRISEAVELLKSGYGS